ncbi:MAG: leucine-rich repeat domain-containing protein [Clostridia bacterium]|nr:leucine-rich repeat domain-containing protein [Clostridia bacterium]
MKKTNKIILASAIVAVILLGIGYAAIQNITLNINGTAAADPSQSNFKIMFSGTPTVSDDTYVTAAITDDTNATINVEGLTKKGDVVTATYTVQNASTDLSADLGVSTTNSNTEFFTLSSEIDKTSLVAGEATTLTVTVELTKTPITESVRATIGVQLEAIPVQPGEEGTSEGINGSSQTPNDTNEYGFYFNKRYVTTVEGYSIGIVFYEDNSGVIFMPDSGATKIPAGAIKYDSYSIDLTALDVGVLTVSSDGRQINVPENELTPSLVLEVSENKPLPNGTMYGSANSSFDSAEWYNEMPEVPLIGDIYMSGDYCYTYFGTGWMVLLATEDGWISNLATEYNFTDKNKTSYEPILESISEKLIIGMIATFEDCTSLITAPEIPDGVQGMDGAFRGCTALTTVPTLPSSATTMTEAFKGCISLTSIPKIPENLPDLNSTFEGCASLTTVPEIPSSVTSLSSTFSGCTSLTTAPEIPSNVLDMQNTFGGCTKLTGEITINANPTYYGGCFSGIDFATQNLTLKGNSTMLDELGATGNNYMQIP